MSAPADRPWFVFAGGGTGGHLYPSLAIIEALRRLDDVDVTFLCTDRPIDRRVLDAAGVEAMPQTVRPFSTKPWRWPAFWRAWRRAIARCEALFTQRRPAAVVGAGGYGSDPPVRAALRLGVHAAILNPDVVPGRANRRLGRHVDRIFAQYEASHAWFPDASGFCAWGCPVRAAFAVPAVERREAGVRRFGLRPTLRTLLVTGASQGARTINETMMALAADVARVSGWQVLHLAGEADVERVRTAYERAGVTATVLAYTEHMPEAMAAADLAVSRAGASTLAELTLAALPSMLLPYPFHRDQHQLHNARQLQEAGAAEIVTDHIDTPANAASVGPRLLALMGDVARLRDMADAARRLARPDAAVRIAEHLLDVAGHDMRTAMRRAPIERIPANAAPPQA